MDEAKLDATMELLPVSKLLNMRHVTQDINSRDIEQVLLALKCWGWWWVGGALGL